MKNRLRKGLHSALNNNGFGFQYAVLEKVKSLYEKDVSPWMFQVAEFPVSNNQKQIHIDFILQNKTQPFLLVGECKRANPKLSNWCFVKTPYVSRQVQTEERVVRETIACHEEYSQPLRTHLDWCEQSGEIYRLSFELKNDIKSSEPCGKGIGRGQINDAVTQVLRGQNGLISCFAKAYDTSNGFPTLFTEQHTVSFIPVIFTTAKLYVTSTNLKEADIESGNTDKASLDLEEKDWLYYHYNQSPDLKHSLRSINKGKDLSETMYHDYTRTIPIVTATGIESFFSKGFWWESKDWMSPSTG